MRDFDNEPETNKRKNSRREFWRIALVVCCLFATVSSGFYVATREEPTAREGEFRFGRHTRVGSIVFVPFAGLVCRQSAFDNDRGMIVPLNDVPCLQVVSGLYQNAKDVPDLNHFDVISATFRK